jgi:hypothetical protein
MSDTGFTVADLKWHLSQANDDDLLEFDGGLSFSRIKSRGDKLVVLEFCEPQAYLHPEFREKNPHVQAAFIRSEPSEEGEMIQGVDVNIY